MVCSQRRFRMRSISRLCWEKYERALEMALDEDEFSAVLYFESIIEAVLISLQYHTEPCALASPNH